MLLPRALSPVVLQGEPGAGVTGAQRGATTHQEEARPGGGGTFQLCQSPGVAAAAILKHKCRRRPGTQPLGVGGGVGRGEGGLGSHSMWDQVSSWPAKLES